MEKIDYNGRPLTADEVLVLTPYEEDDARTNVTRKENIVTVKKNGVAVKAILKAVPVEYAPIAKAQFNSWQREFLPKETEGRCLVPQPDGSVKECPKKRGNNRVSCENCPHRNEYDRKVVGNLSIEAFEEEFGYAFATSPSAADELEAEEELTESQQRTVHKFLELMDKSPKHCLAMLLMALGYRGEEFANRMHLGHDAANRVRNQVLSLAGDGGLVNFGQIDFRNLKVNRVGDTEYYRSEAMKALETVVKMHF